MAKKGTVAVAMSGGVDSAAAALLLAEAGYDVWGVTLRLQSCPGAAETAEAEIDSARRAAEALGIPHRVLDLRERFRTAVMDRFVSEYLAGRTPNPCVDCNREIKFGALLDWVLEQGADFLSTGHYARVDRAEGRWRLLRGADRRKDQSYVLYQLTQRQLSHLLLPLGDYDKPAIRQMVEARGLANARKADSQDICFIPDGDYAAFLAASGAELVPGDFVDETGRVLGRHRGLPCYTPGQRKGLGVSAGEPVYVLRKEAAGNRIILGPDSALYTAELTAERVNWLSVPAPEGPLAVTAKTRYTQREAAATAEVLPDGRLRVTFAEPQRAVTAGQAVVLYVGEAVAGGGTIC
ncbi:tRNA 2-thiouridine(34) synthase MnmA [Dysosmobacter sp.]|uniref:tRNA 2-thiouridine(34) synthase MnmA n=1 Tax=Dysosmobacter sp. TaxID=2591382 RepID=UPI003AB82B1F